LDGGDSGINFILGVADMKKPNRTIQDHFDNEWTQGLQWPSAFLKKHGDLVIRAIIQEWVGANKDQQSVMDGDSMSQPHLTYLDFKYLNLIVVTRVKLLLLKKGMKKAMIRMNSADEIRILAEVLRCAY